MVTSDTKTSFSQRLNVALDEAGVPPKGSGRQIAVAKMFGVSQKGARKWLEGEAIPDTKRLPEIARKLGVQGEWLLTGQGARRNKTSDELNESRTPGVNAFPIADETGEGTIMIPRFCLAASAGGGCWPPDDPIIDRMVFKQSWIRRMFPAVSLAALAVMSVHGDSMSPTLRDGDLMLIDRSVEEIGPEGVYVLTIEGDLYVKRVQREPGQLIIKSDNAMYRTWEVPRGALEQVRVHGRMVYYWRGERG